MTVGTTSTIPGSQSLVRLGVITIAGQGVFVGDSKLGHVSCDFGDPLLGNAASFAMYWGVTGGLDSTPAVGEGE